MDTKKLRQKILDLAIHGKLVAQDPNDEPASVLLERIRAEKEQLTKEGKIKKSKKSTKTSDTPHYENVPFEVPRGWVWCRLEELTQVLSSKRIHKDDYVPVGVPFYRTTEVKELSEGLPISNCLYISQEQFDRINTKFGSPNAGDILISAVGTIGITYIVSNNSPFYFKDGNLIWIKKCDYIMSEFLSRVLYHFVRSENKIETSGSAYNALTIEKLNDLFIPLPPLAEQQRIVAEIERWFALVDIIEQGKDNLQATIAQAKSKILDLAIHGKLVPQDPSDEPAIELLRRINPKFTPCDNAQYENIPSNWSVAALNDICTFLSRGKSPKYSETEKTYPVFAQKCNLKEGGISLDQARFLDPTTIDKWKEEYKLRTGDVLINSTGTGTVGRTRLFDEVCLGTYPFVVPDSHVTVIRSHALVDSAYLYIFMSSPLIQEYLSDNLAGSTNQKELYIGVLKELETLVPPLAEQHRIAQKVDLSFKILDFLQSFIEA